MTLFDPMGFISHFIVKGKILMQQIWKAKIDWDEELPENFKVIWRRMLENLKSVNHLRVPRCYSLNIPNAVNMELHTFTDSSKEAFAAISYLRVESKDKIETMIVISKTRVAPMKELSIPRLELQGAILGSRTATYVIESLEMPINRVYFWTDSMCVLGCIRDESKKYKQFVSNRVAEIRTSSNVDQWRWVSTSENPADLATRQASTKLDMEFWMYGPQFLRESKQYWPQEDTKLVNDPQSIAEEKSGICLVIQEFKYNGLLPEIERFSKYTRILFATARFLRITHIFEDLLCKIRSRDSLTIPQDVKKVIDQDIRNAEELLWQKSQWDCFSKAVMDIKSGKKLDRQNALNPLCPKLKNNLLIVGGRTDLSPVLDEETKSPIILYPKHHLTQLLIQKYHEDFNHQGVETVLNELRQKYWIINGRRAVKSVFQKCLRCKVARAKPIVPLMGQLPELLLQKGKRAFINIGMDYFGPICIKIGRRIEKRWGVLFTCLAVRAIHLEIAHSLTSDSAIQAIMRMVSRRGIPEKILCDNGTNFHGASKELKEALRIFKIEELQENLAVKGIEFLFNPPASPHMGGVWERLIGSVKKVMGKVLFQQPIKEEILRTFLAEAEFIVNSRPLTRVSSDPNDLESITPNHFLIGSSCGSGIPMPKFLDGKTVRAEWHRARSLTETFWKRWMKEYLPTLTKRNKWTNEKQCIKEGDLVLLADENVPRFQWRLGRITNLYRGPDTRVRVVDVKTNHGEYRRSVHKICRLEIED